MRRLKIEHDTAADIAEVTACTLPVGAAVVFLIHPNGNIELGYSVKPGYGQLAGSIVNAVGQMLGAGPMKLQTVRVDGEEVAHDVRVGDVAALVDGMGLKPKTEAN